MTRPVKEAASASAKGKPRPVGIAAWKVRKAILAIPATDLSSAGKVLLSVVADYAGYGQSTCWATNESLAFSSGLAIRQVQHLLGGRTQSKTNLISMGWLTSTWKTTWKGGNAHRDLALGPNTLKWIERILPRLDTKFRARPSMDWDEQLCPPRDEQLFVPRDEQLCPQNSPSLEHSQIEQSSSSSTPPPLAENPTTTTCASLPKTKSGGSKQKAQPLSDADGLWMVCRVACQCPHLPGMAAKLRADRNLETRIRHDWHGLARQVARLEEMVAAREIKFGSIKNPASYVVGMLEKLRSNNLPAAKLDALDATVERLLESASSPGPRKQPAAPQPRPDPAAAIAKLERELLGIEADIAAASKPTEKRCLQRALDQGREELAALKTAGRTAP